MASPHPQPPAHGKPSGTPGGQIPASMRLGLQPNPGYLAPYRGPYGKRVERPLDARRQGLSPQAFCLIARTSVEGLDVPSAPFDGHDVYPFASDAAHFHLDLHRWRRLVGEGEAKTASALEAEVDEDAWRLAGGKGEHKPRAHRESSDRDALQDFAHRLMIPLISYGDNSGYRLGMLEEARDNQARLRARAQTERDSAETIDEEAVERFLAASLDGRRALLPRPDWAPPGLDALYEHWLAGEILHNAPASLEADIEPERSALHILALAEEKAVASGAQSAARRWGGQAFRKLVKELRRADPERPLPLGTEGHGSRAKGYRLFTSPEDAKAWQRGELARALGMEERADHMDKRIALWWPQTEQACAIVAGIVATAKAQGPILYGAPSPQAKRLAASREADKVSRARRKEELWDQDKPYREACRALLTRTQDVVSGPRDDGEISMPGGAVWARRMAGQMTRADRLLVHQRDSAREFLAYEDKVGRGSTTAKFSLRLEPGERRESFEHIPPRFAKRRAKKDGK